MLVHKFVCRGTVEERIDELIASKQGLSEECSPVAASRSDRDGDEELLRLVALDLNAAMRD